MKRLAILIVLVLVAAGAGGAGWWFFLRETPAQDGAGVEAGREGADGVKAERFVKLAPMNLPVLREGRVILHLTMQLSIELTEPRTLEQLAELTPRLRDALLSELHALFAYRHVQDRGYDIPVVKARLLQAGERVLGAGEVKSVLIQNITQRSPKAG